jgi:hypothetical protein
MGQWCLFCSDWREAFLISWSYGMEDPMTPSDSEGNSEGGRMSRPGEPRLVEKAPSSGCIGA